MRVLVVEDDPSVSHWLKHRICAEGHDCRLAADGECGLSMIETEAFDVVVLDRGLPRMDGMTVLSRLRNKPAPPVLILSANDQVRDRISGLRAGASDYLGKPFDFAEFLLRIEILARRHGTADTADIIRIEDLRIDTQRREVWRNGRRIELTNKEFRLLSELATHRGHAVSRSMLMEKVWGRSFSPQTNLIDVHMSNLRTKIDGGSDTPLLRTVRSIGYVLG